MPLRARLAATSLLSVMLCAPIALAQDSTDQPLSVIDWLGSQTASLPAPAPVVPNIDEPAVATTATAPAIKVTPLGQGAAREIGLVPAQVTGLPATIWAGSDPDTLTTLISSLPHLQLPAAQALLFTVLLAEAEAPGGDPAAGDALALERVSALMRRGAIDPALSLIEQAGVTQSPAHFDLWMTLSLLSGTEDRPCNVLRSAPHLTSAYDTLIFCAARAQQWENAALTFGSAQALSLLPEWKLALLDRFLNPDLFEDAAPLPVPRRPDALALRLFEAIGETLPTAPLPRAYAALDLRDLAGWKAQLEAAERLSRAGALPDNRLLGLYTERRAAASGGVWDRVRAVQNLDTALTTGSAEAVTKTLVPAWKEARQAGLAYGFADLFAERVAAFDLQGRAGDIALTMALLSPLYEKAASALPDTDLRRHIAEGSVPAKRPGAPQAGAVFDAFNGAPPRADLLAGVQNQQLGATILHLLHLLHEGQQGDPTALRDALATLRAIGLEDTARRAALQILLLEVG